MNISFENPDKINGRLALTIEASDFQEKVDKQLKDYRKTARVPGFRPGQAPIGMIKRMVGAQVKYDVINRFVDETTQKYLADNGIRVLGGLLPAEDGEPVNLDAEPPYTIRFDIPVAPEFKAELTDKDKIDYYDIQVDDKLVDQQVEMFRNRMRRNEKVDAYDAEQNDMLKGDLRQLDAEGNTLEGGITVSDALLMPQYMKVDEQKQLFKSAKLGDIIVFNPRKAYPESDVEISSLLKIEKEQAKDITADFSFQVTEITRSVPAEVNQELFDQVFGEGSVKSEKEFREKIAQGVKQQMAGEEDYKFMLDVRSYLEKKIGKVDYPEALLKRVILQNGKEKDEKKIDEHFEDELKGLHWQLIKEQLLVAQQIKVEEDDVKAVAKDSVRMQWAQNYGINNLPDEYVENFAADMLKRRENVERLADRAAELKLTAALKNVVKLNVKKVSVDDFNKLMQEK